MLEAFLGRLRLATLILIKNKTFVFSQIVEPTSGWESKLVWTPESASEAKKGKEVTCLILFRFGD